MSKMGNWVLEMQENAVDMTLEQFTNTYGKREEHIWREANGEEPDFGRPGEPGYVQHVNSGYGDEIPF
jgi:hypothetical protein